MERRLAAIFAADVVGFSRLVGADEEGTLRTLSAYRQVIDELVAEHSGRVFSSAGDSVVAEFASPVEAVRCAADIQRDLERRNAEQPEDRRMRFRIGINLGDVVVEGDNLLGDGVNVAARLEALSVPGGISISRSVRDQIRDKLKLRLEDQGEVTVKNITRPIRVFRVLLDDISSTEGPAAENILLSADVRGFALLMGDDDDLASADLAHNRTLFTQAIDQHDGRALEPAGDSIAALFSTPADAARCAIEAQTAIAAWNDSVPPERRLRFRVGIELADEGAGSRPGTVGVVGTEFYAVPGEVCVSGDIYERLAGESSFQLEEISETPDDQAVFKLERFQFTPVHILQRRNNFGIGWG